MAMSDLKKCRRLSIIPRWSIVPTIHRQSVAEHSFQVIALSRWLAEKHRNAPRVSFVCKVLVAALYHDMDEALTGDPPGGPLKKVEWDEKVAAEGQVWAVVKLADMIEAHLFLMEEELLGNKNLQQIIDAYELDINALIRHIEFRDGVEPDKLLGQIMKQALGFDLQEHRYG